MQGINLLGTGSTIGRQRYSPSAVSTSYAGVTPVTTHPKSGQRPHIAARLRAREAETRFDPRRLPLTGAISNWPAACAAKVESRQSKVPHEAQRAERDLCFSFPG